MCYDMSTGNEGGGAGGSTDVGEGASTEGATDPLGVGETGAGETGSGEGETPEGDQSQDIDFENLFDENGEAEVSIDPEKYAGLKEAGINIDSPTFKQQIKELNDLGITDPTVQANLLKKARENEQKELNKTPEQIKEQLNKELLPEAKHNYKAINNVVKEIWGSDPETYKAIMSDSVAINMMAKVHAYYKGQAPADVTPSNTKPVASGFDVSGAEAEYQKLMAEAYGKGKGYEMREAVIEKVLSKTSPQYKKQVAEMFGVNK